MKNHGVENKSKGEKGKTNMEHTLSGLSMSNHVHGTEKANETTERGNAIQEILVNKLMIFTMKH